jgi:hypothetical protein
MNSSEARLYVEDRRGHEIDSGQVPEEIQGKVLRAPMRLCPSCIGGIETFNRCKRDHYRKKYFTSRVNGIDTFPRIYVA